MNGEGNRDWEHGIHMSRFKAHIVETRVEKPRKMDLLFVARWLRSPIIDSTTSRSNNRVSKHEGPVPLSGVVTKVGRELEIEGSSGDEEGDD